MTVRPSMFIASSTEGRDVARALQQNLDPDAEITVWDQDCFQLSKHQLVSLRNELLRSEFAVFVFSPDDVALIRGDSKLIVRDNVILELGMSFAALGIERSFIVVPRGQPDLRVPTNLYGLTYADYDLERRDANPVAALGAAANRIRRAMETILTPPEPSKESTTRSAEPRLAQDSHEQERLPVRFRVTDSREGQGLNIGKQFAPGVWLGKAWQFHTDVRGHAIFGPYLDPALPKGSYVATFRLKVANLRTGNRDIVRVEVASAVPKPGQKFLHLRELTAQDFDKSDTYKDFSLRFEVYSDEPLLELRVFSMGRGSTVTLDYVDLDCAER